MVEQISNGHFRGSEQVPFDVHYRRYCSFNLPAAAEVYFGLLLDFLDLDIGALLGDGSRDGAVLGCGVALLVYSGLSPGGNGHQDGK